MVEATKKRRKEEDAEYIDNLNKNCGERLAKREHDGQLLQIWQKIFKLLTAADSNRKEKPENMRWCDYFQELAEVDSLKAPSAFCSSSMSSEDAMIKVGGHIASLKKALSTASNYVDRTKRAIAAREKIIEKRERTATAKVEKMLQDPEALEAKEKKSKHLGWTVYWSITTLTDFKKIKTKFPDKFIMWNAHFRNVFGSTKGEVHEEPSLPLHGVLSSLGRSPMLT